MENSQFAQLLIDMGALASMAQKESAHYMNECAKLAETEQRLTEQVTSLKNERATLIDRAEKMRAQVNELQIKLAKRRK